MKKILIVDDEIKITSVLNEFLTKGYNVFTADDGDITEGIRRKVLHCASRHSNGQKWKDWTH